MNGGGVKNLYSIMEMKELRLGYLIIIWNEIGQKFWLKKKS